MSKKNPYIPVLLTIGCVTAAWVLIRKQETEESLLNNDRDMRGNTKLPRGYRNNNPLNIRYNLFNAWKGKVLINEDKNATFEQFVTMAYGYRAALYLLRKYIRQGANSIAAIISRWAPENENNTQAYIQHVCEFVTDLGTPVNAGTIVRADDKDLLCKMAYAMSIIENGVTDETRAAGLPDMSIIEQGWDLL